MSADKPTRPARRKLLRIFLRCAVSCAAVFIAGAALLFYTVRSAGFENWARRNLVARIEQTVGGRAEIKSFHWRPFDLEAEAGGVVIHGREAPAEAPFASIDQLRVRLRLMDFWSPRILLRDLEVVHPEFHLIVYPDGSTNQPQPRKPVHSKESAIDTIFDIQAGRVAVEQGVVDFENRAAAFDFQNRFTLLDFSARDLSLQMSYAPKAQGSPESYHIEAGARDLTVTRGAPPAKRQTAAKAQTAEGYVQASLDLTRNALYVRSLRLTSRARDSKGREDDHTLEISAALQDFSRPRWQGRVSGELDMRLLDPITGFPFSPEGIARLDLTGAGQGGQFRFDGGVHVDGGSYIDPSVNARGIGLDAHVHADPEQLLITSIVARLMQGGQLEGTVALDHWLPPIPGAPAIERAGQNSVRAVPGTVPASRVHPPPIPVPVNGKVTARLKDVSVDTILDIVGQPPLQRLGFDTLLNGPASATWSKGDNATVVVEAALDFAPAARPVTGEVPASGTVDGTYKQRDGSVDLRKLEFHTPGGELDAHGELGAYPATSPSDLTVNFRSRDLLDYDTFLRDLGLQSNGKSGVAALPASLEGEVDYRGTWTGSLVDPHLAGSAQATNIAIETLPGSADRAGEPQWVHWDTVQATGSYSAERISIDHGFLRRGETGIVLSGTLAAAPNAGQDRHETTPEFDQDSQLNLRLRADNLTPDQLQPLTGQELPLTGAIAAQLQVSGPIHALAGTGSAELDEGAAFGQPIERVRAQATLANQVLKLSSLTANEAGGAISATGSVHLDSKQFQLDARATGIDVSKIDWLRRHRLESLGKLGVVVTGLGSLDDPRIDAHATFDGLSLNGEPLGPLEITARTANHAMTYTATTRIETAGLALHGQTALTGDYATQAKLEFSEFNIDALLKMAAVEGLTGESALAGTISIDGPLARLDGLRGDARLNDLSATIAGVHLKSEGGLHAALADGRITLDPLHVTGEETDLHAQGTLALEGQKKLDFAASGAINMKLGQMLDPDLTASGTTTFQVEAHGPLNDPGLRGRIDFENCSLALEDVPNGLSQLHGTLEFNQDRLEVKSLTAMSGGGLLSVAGYLAYQHGLYADLRVSGKGIRIRYPAGVSSLADASFHLLGARDNLLLSGNVMITRFSVSPDVDFASLATQANVVQPIVPPDAPSNHIRLDIHIVSSPQLNFQTTVAKLAGDVDLHLRGTLASPTLLGTVQITEGTATLAGTRYELQRGSISFTNPVRIEPSIDLSATAHVSDYDITLGLHGTPSKMSITYRSDPPLPEADVVALLALGRTQDQQRLYTQQQEQEGASPTTDVLLGGALNATVSSRVQKLFGAGSVKIDPNYLGALGNSTTRIIVQEQVGRNMTLTYATNVDTTQQQLLQAEIAINRHVSLQVARDESGVFSMVLKATRRYR
ncbi:MAG: translocation/assembly module TamB domain-containing protein [Terracidiphilus sp.]